MSVYWCRLDSLKTAEKQANDIARTKKYGNDGKKLKEVQNALSDASEESEKAKRLVKLTEGLATHEDIDILFMDVMKNSCELLGCDRSTLWIKSLTTDELYSKVALGTDSIRIHTSKGLVGHSYRNCVTVNIKERNDARFDPSYDKSLDTEPSLYYACL